MTIYTLEHLYSKSIKAKNKINWR